VNKDGDTIWALLLSVLETCSDIVEWNLSETCETLNNFRKENATHRTLKLQPCRIVRLYSIKRSSSSLSADHHHTQDEPAYQIHLQERITQFAAEMWNFRFFRVLKG
jgi:hypothetical protein